MISTVTPSLRSVIDTAVASRWMNNLWVVKPRQRLGNVDDYKSFPQGCIYIYIYI